MEQKFDYYKILGIRRNATPEEIRHAYLAAARRLHPDANTAPGETEFFLHVQEAYEILTDSEKRSKYDELLPLEKTSGTPVAQRILFSRKALMRLNEPQLIYALLEYSPERATGGTTSPPLNIALILDRSTSMQGRHMDVVKATAIQILRRLRPQDTFSVIAFSDKAEVVIPATANIDPSKLEARIQMLNSGGGTEIFNGLEAGYNEVRLTSNRSHIDHLILLTDGKTYGDEERCITLADQAAKQGIGISGFGIGHEWNDTFLDELAARTGGSSQYISEPQEIQRSLIEKFNQLGQVFSEETRLTFTPSAGVELRYAFRIQPDCGMLPNHSPMMLGPILRQSNLKVLLEFSVNAEATRSETAVLFDGEGVFNIPAESSPQVNLKLRLLRPVTNKTTPDLPPQEIVESLSRLMLYRLQDQARQEVAAGQYDQAVKKLQRLATHLLEIGERGLARTALLEAEHIQREKSFSQVGNKQIKYGTRALLLAGEEKKL